MTRAMVGRDPLAWGGGWQDDRGIRPPIRLVGPSPAPAPAPG